MIDEHIRIRDFAPLAYQLPADVDAEEALFQLERQHFDAAPIGDERVHRFVRAEELKLLPGSAFVGEHANEIDPLDVVGSDSTLADVLPLLRERPILWVETGTSIDRVLTASDLGTPLGGLAVFDYVLRLESNLDVLIERHVSDWRKVLPEDRLKKAQTWHRKAQKREWKPI